MFARRTLVPAVAAWLALAVGSAASAAAIPEGSTYVAMGSSYASGPGVAQLADGWTPRCSQSTDNYARQVARALKLRLVDRSCGGAVTADIVKGGQFGLPPQLDGITPDTRLVTVTIGGNDVRYMAELGVAACRQTNGACPAAADFDLEAAFRMMEANLRTIAAEVHRRAPQARLVFVDYITLFPAGPPCPALAISAEDEAQLRARAERLARITAVVARESGADLIKASDLTRSHDACAADPWVNGFIAHRAPGWGPVSFHPRLPAMTAIAQALEQRLAR